MYNNDNNVTDSKLVTSKSCPTLKETFRHGMVAVIDTHVIQWSISFWNSKFLIIYILGGDFNFTNGEILGIISCYLYISVIQQFKWLQFNSPKFNLQQFPNANSNNLKFLVFRCNRTKMLLSIIVLSISKPIKYTLAL